MKRRTFLVLASGLLCGPSSLRAEAKKGSISLGFSLYGMKAVPLLEGIETCAKVGYQAVELAVMPGWPADPVKLSKEDRKAIREKLASTKIDLSDLMENTPLDGDAKSHSSQLERLERALELGQELSPEKPPIIETILGGKVDQWEQIKNQFRDRLGDWAKLAEKTKSIIAIKPHRFGAMNRPEQALWLLEQVKSKSIRLVYDWSHYEQRDLKLDETLKALIPSTVFVHIKDTRIVNGKAEFLLPGEGSTDYSLLLKGLVQHGYSGCVCIEVSGMIHNQKDYDGVATATKCFTKLKPMFEKEGR